MAFSKSRWAPPPRSRYSRCSRKAAIGSALMFLSPTKVGLSLIRIFHPSPPSAWTVYKTVLHKRSTARGQGTGPRGERTMAMEHRRLGGQGLVVSALGLGCMGMSWAYGPRDDAESIATIHEAIDRGITLLDTAEVYGPYENEKLL